MSERHPPSRESSGAEELILADLKHFEEKLWRNEEAGEKRLSYFITLLTAAVGGLVALHTTKDLPATVPLATVRNGTLGVLFLFGVTTYFRMLRRNEVTDGYKATTDYLRRRYAKLVGTTDYVVPRPMEPRWHKPVRGSLADMAALGTSTLLATLILSLGNAGARPSLWPIAIAAGAGCFALMWRGAALARKTPARSQSFRANVGAVLMNDGTRVLAFERSDRRSAWQLPQGGIEGAEDPEDAVRREIREETGIPEQALRSLGQHPELLVYELPESYRSPKTGRGQVQYWFYFETTAEPRLPEKGEFRSWRWMELSQLREQTAPFRSAVYAKLAEHVERELRQSCPSDSEEPTTR